MGLLRCHPRCHPNGVFWLQKRHDLVLWIVTHRLLNPHLGKERLVHESGHALGTENPRLLAYGDNPFLEPPDGDGWIGSANGEVFPEYAVGVVGTQYPVLYLQVLVVVFGCFLLPLFGRQFIGALFNGRKVIIRFLNSIEVDVEIKIIRYAVLLVWLIDFYLLLVHLRLRPFLRLFYILV